jgi:predicted DNA-binding protein
VEDREDYLLAVEVSKRNEKTFSLEEVRRKLGLDA